METRIRKLSRMSPPKYSDVRALGAENHMHPGRFDLYGRSIRLPAMYEAWWISLAFDHRVPVEKVAAEIRELVDEQHQRFEVGFLSFSGDDRCVSLFHDLPCTMDDSDLMSDLCRNDLHIRPVLETEEFDSPCRLRPIRSSRWP